MAHPFSSSDACVPSDWAGAGGVTPPPPDLKPDEIVDMGTTSALVLFLCFSELSLGASTLLVPAYNRKSLKFAQDDTKEIMQWSSSGQTGLSKWHHTSDLDEQGPLRA